MTSREEAQTKIEGLSIAETYKKHLKPEEVREILERGRLILENQLTWAESVNRIPSSGIPAAEESFQTLLLMLFLTEGLAAYNINSIIYALMLKEHHDIWFEEK